VHAIYQTIVLVRCMVTSLGLVRPSSAAVALHPKRPHLCRGHYPNRPSRAGQPDSLNQICVTVRRPRPKVYCTLVLGSGLRRNRRRVAEALPTPELAPGPARSRSSRPDLVKLFRYIPSRPCGSTSSKLARTPRWPLARAKIDSE